MLIDGLVRMIEIAGPYDLDAIAAECRLLPRDGASDDDFRRRLLGDIRARGERIGVALAGGGSGVVYFPGAVNGD
jgi:hypothetical protein